MRARRRRHREGERFTIYHHPRLALATWGSSVMLVFVRERHRKVVRKHPKCRKMTSSKSRDLHNDVIKSVANHVALSRDLQNDVIRSRGHVPSHVTSHVTNYG